MTSAAPLVLGAVALVVLAFGLRVAVHAGQTPGGVDSWYYLAFADALRRRPSLDVRLPQYLLQDLRQSYPPLFPAFLALLPRAWLRRWFWVVSPAIDCVHLVFLYVLAWRITASVGVALLTGAVFALTPHMVSETRSLNGRSFGAILHSVAMVLALKAVLLGPAWPWLVPAVLSATAVFLASATAAAGYAVSCAVLAVVLEDVRYAALPGAALALAFVLTGGRFAAVIANYLHAVRYWLRNRARFGAHPIRDSPLYGTPSARPAVRPGFLGGSTAQQLLRVVGESPFLLALPYAPPGVPLWGTGLYWWAVALASLAVVATVLPPLRAFGPGRAYIKTATFPVAYTLAVSIGTVRSMTTSRVGLVTLACLVASGLSIAFFYVYTWRRATERTADTPPGLAAAAARLAELPGDGVFCLPYMYADYVCYESGKSVLWGGHCGDLRPLEAVAPVLTRPVEDLMAEHGVRYLLLDRLYAGPEDVGLAGRVRPVGRWGTFELHERVEAPGASAT